MARRRTQSYYKNPRPSPKSAGMSDGAKIAFALAGIAVVGGVGWYFWNQSQASSTAAVGGGTITSGNQPYQLGTSTTTSMPAADASGTNIDYATSTATGPSAATAPPVSQSIELG